jgi:hypothetical protein
MRRGTGELSTPQQYSPENPFAGMVSNYAQQVQASAPKQHEGVFKNLLRSFLTGGGEAMMTRAGLTPPSLQRQLDQQNFERTSQLANQWESNQSEINYKQALLENLQQNERFQSQMQPVELQRLQMENAAFRQIVRIVNIAAEPAVCHFSRRYAYGTGTVQRTAYLHFQLVNCGALRRDKEWV